MSRGTFLLAWLACCGLAAAASAQGFGAVGDAVRGAASQAVQSTTSDAISVVLRKPTLYLNEAEGKLAASDVTPNKKEVLLVFETGDPRVWNFDNGQQYRVGAAAHWTDLSLDPTGRFVLGRDAADHVQAADVMTGRAVDYATAARELLAAQGSAAMFLGHGGDVASGGSKGADRGIRAAARGKAIGYSADGQMAAVYGSDVGKIEIVPSVATRGEQSVALPDRVLLTVTDIRMASGGGASSIAYVGLSGGGVYADFAGKPVKLNVLGRPIAVGLVDGKQQAICVMEDGRFLITDADGTNVSSGQSDLITGAVRVWTYKQGSIVVVLRKDGRLIGLDRTGKLAFTAVTTANQWAVMDEKGRYDQPSGASGVGWTVGDVKIGMDRFARDHFEPGLLARYTTQPEIFLASGEADFAKGVAAPPTVVSMTLNSKSRDASVANQVIVTVRNADAPIQAVELFQNGKQVPPSNVIYDQTSNKSNVSVRGVAFNVHPIPGQDVFRAVPIGLGAIEGQDARLAETFTGSLAGQSLHVLAVGINHYAASNLTLGYAASDAVRLVDQLKQSASRFSHVTTDQLIDRDATKPAILAALAKLKTEARPEDTVVLYFAGHGIVRQNQWYFVAQNATSFTAEALQQAGLSSAEIYNALIDIPAEKIMLMMDSCYSGEVTESLDPFAAQRATTVIARMSGVAVLAASRGDQSALEAPQLGGGLFTYVVVRGLKGEADKGKTGRVTVVDLMDFAESVMPGLYRDKLREPQMPGAYFGGTDFYLASTLSPR